MSKSPTGIIPEELMRPTRKADVMVLLSQLPVPGNDKVDLLIGWAKMVGASINAAQRQAVRVTGTDYIRFPGLSSSA